MGKEKISPILFKRSSQVCICFCFISSNLKHFSIFKPSYLPVILTSTFHCLIGDKSSCVHVNNYFRLLGCLSFRLYFSISSHSGVKELSAHGLHLRIPYLGLPYFTNFRPNIGLPPTLHTMLSLAAGQSEPDLRIVNFETTPLIILGEVKPRYPQRRYLLPNIINFITSLPGLYQRLLLINPSDSGYLIHFLA